MAVKLSVAFREINRRGFYKLSQPDPETGCRIWIGQRNSRNYGLMRICGVTWLAHRFAWLEAGRVIPPETPFVLHECDNPPCVEITHLKLGTHDENGLDKLRRNRARKSRMGLPRGVAYHDRGKRFQACIYSRAVGGGKPSRYYLGSFEAMDEAAKIADAARQLRDLLPHLFPQRLP